MSKMFLLIIKDNFHDGSRHCIIPKLKMTGPAVHFSSDLCDEHGRVSLMWNRIGGVGTQKQLFHPPAKESHKSHPDFRNPWDPPNTENCDILENESVYNLPSSF